jgi:hypothetical protein
MIINGLIIQKGWMSLGCTCITVEKREILTYSSKHGWNSKRRRELHFEVQEKRCCKSLPDV